MKSLLENPSCKPLAWLRRHRLAKFATILVVAAFALAVYTQVVHIGDPVQSVEAKYDLENHVVNLNDLDSTSDDIAKLFQNFSFQDGATIECFLPGTDFERTAARDASGCKCRGGYRGRDCGVPQPVWAVPAHANRTFARRARPRRLVLAVVVNHEMEMLKIRLGSMAGESSAAVTPNVLVVAESNVTAAGEPKPLNFAKALAGGDFHEVDLARLLYVRQGEFPEGAVRDGWAADHFIRSHMSGAALSRLRGLRHDDLFLTFDADEIPRPEVLTFLKLYDVLARPPIVALRYRHNLYGFFWRAGEAKAITAGSTVEFMQKVCGGDAYLVRGLKMETNCTGWGPYSRDFVKLNDWRESVFVVGTEEHPGGHHCSYCLGPEGIRQKMLSAQKADKPRWGNFPEKTDLRYIRENIRKGRNFDGTRTSKRVFTLSGDPDVAPEYVLKHQSQFKHLLLHPDDLP